MDTERNIDIQYKVLDKLIGKIYLIQDQDEKEKAVSLILSDVCGAIGKDTVLYQVKALQSEKERSDFIKNFLSYGVIEDLLADHNVEDIIINSTKHIFVHHAKKGLIKTDKRFKTQLELDLFVRKLVVFSGRTSVKKLINVVLPNVEGRVNIAYSPMGYQVTITRTKPEPLSILNLIERGGLSYDLAAQLWLYAEGLSVRPANIIIAGGPGTGKTTLLNALLSFVPPNDRMVIIEDTLELNTQWEESCSRLECDEDLTLAALVKNSLRMRPERIIVGEVRGEEARDLMTAVNIGKYAIGTIHAGTAREAILRLQNEPMNVPPALLNLLDVFVVMKKFAVKDRGTRVIDEVSETGGLENKTVLLSQVWKYDYENKRFSETSPSTVYRDRLSWAAGITPKEIMDEIKVRSRVLEVLHARNITSLPDVTTFCRAYSIDSRSALAQLGIKREEIFPKETF